MRLRLALVAAALVAPAAAQAFCGTYVGSPGAELYSGGSKVVIAREGTRTVLTLTNDVQGSVKDFAMVIPVPTVLAEGDVRVLEPSVIDRIDEYAGPRLVEYACSDFYDDDGQFGRGCGGCVYDDYAMSDSDAGGLGPPSLDVTVEAEFAAGEYDIVILSSEDSADLLTWLDQQGYGVPPETQDLLTEYIEQDVKFLAAKVRLDDVPIEAGPAGRPYLSPLQLTYQTDAFSLPIRLGTVNSPGEQDLVIYTLTSGSDGEVGIANYDQGALPTDCMWDEARHGTLVDFIDGQMDAQVDEHAGATWVNTYSWNASGCDPCPGGDPLEEPVLRSLGFEGDPWDAHVTRLWMRYAADAVDQDVALYATGNWGQSQLRYITYETYLESQFPVCLEGMVDNPGTCDDEPSARRRGGLGGVAPWFGLLSLLGLGIGLRRRR